MGRGRNGRRQNEFSLDVKKTFMILKREEMIKKLRRLIKQE
jgi:hypothetical protein